MQEQEKYVKQFISQIQKKYPNIKIQYVYTTEDDIFDIWHNSKELQFENKEFLKFVGKQIKELFFNNNIFNISFGYRFNK